LNPGNEQKAKDLQQQLNHISELIGSVTDEEQAARFAKALILRCP